VRSGPEELRGLQGDREREDLSDERPGCGRGGGGPGRQDLRKGDLNLMLRRSQILQPLDGLHGPG